MLNSRKKAKELKYKNFESFHKANEEKRLVRLNEEALKRKATLEAEKKAREKERALDAARFAAQAASREKQRMGEIKKELSEVPVTLLPPKLEQVSILSTLLVGSIDILPSYEEIPSVFRCEYNPYVVFVKDWFYRGIKEWPKNFSVREGVIFKDAIASIKGVLSSFEPTHEHKMAGAAYLCYQWFSIK